jgi:molybdopterin converting factor small subunit
MSIEVELFGIPRSRAGVTRSEVEGTTLGELLANLVARYPGLSPDCIVGERLRDGYVANLNGARFVRDPATMLAAGDAVLILSADAGG